MRYSLAILLLLVLAGCREAQPPFDTDEYGPRTDTGAVRLSYNPVADHAPTWASDSDTVYYTAASFPGLPIASDGVLLALPRAGGAARLIMPAIQVGIASPRWLSTPAFTKNGDRIAFFDLNVVRLPECAELVCPFNADTLLAQVQLVSGVLRVRDVDGLGNDLATVSVPFAGRDLDTTRHPGGVEGVTILHAYPFQRRFNIWRMPVFRPVWSPDGTRLVYSDGLQLLLWTPGAAPVPIPNTDDGAWPAWSADGQTIAYTRLIRGGSSQYTCTCLSSTGFPIEVQERTVYSGWGVEGTLTLINPDGSNKRELGTGEGPAWLADGRIVVTRGARLWIVSAAGNAISEIPNTDFAAAPAVSPDGKYIAFTRQTGERDWDIWVVPVPASAQ